MQASKLRLRSPIRESARTPIRKSAQAPIRESSQTRSENPLQPPIRDSSRAPDPGSSGPTPDPGPKVIPGPDPRLCDTRAMTSESRSYVKRAAQWSGTWTRPPLSLHSTPSGDLIVGAEEGSDAWRITSYGFIHDSAHALVAPVEAPRALEVVFTVDYSEQFDQAGLFIESGPEEWLKAGVEFADGAPQLGAVVTRGMSDWSVAPRPDLAGRKVRLRASWAGDAVTLRAGVDGQPLSLLRVAPWTPTAPVRAGLFCCAPTRAGLEVVFHECGFVDADASLH